MNLSGGDILTYVIVFVVVFSLFYILYAAIMILYRGLPAFGLFKSGKSGERGDRSTRYDKLVDETEESVISGEETEIHEDYIDNLSKFGGDRIKDLVKNPPSSFEKYVRDKFEKLTSYKFPTVYPSWLTSGKKTFELDGYNKMLGVAFETQGPQHYEFNKKYYTNYLDYYTRILHDQIKRKKCEKYGVALIIVDHSIPKQILGYYIGSRLWDICREKSLIEQSEASNIKKMPYSKVNCAELEKHCGVWGNIGAKPAMYVEKINRTPYRNYELEKQMVLEGIL